MTAGVGVAQPLSSQPVIVDLCTGAGALALALAKLRPGARVIAIDDSDDALAYARRNIAGASIELVRADVTRPRCFPVSTEPWTWSSPIRHIYPMAGLWNPKWPSMIRRMRSSGDRTGWPSSTTSSSSPHDG